jgi:purine-binding chemotaxis protein CheW
MHVKNPLPLRQFVSFTVGGALYGFDIHIVKEITPMVSITPVPLMKTDISGVVNIRGQVVVVLNIAAILNENVRNSNSDSQIVILRTSREITAGLDYKPTFDPHVMGDKPAGFLVDSVGEIIAVEASRVEGAPTHLGAIHTQYIEGVVHLDEPLIVLDVSKILVSSQ